VQGRQPDERRHAGICAAVPQGADDSDDGYADVPVVKSKADYHPGPLADRRARQVAQRAATGCSSRRTWPGCPRRTSIAASAGSPPRASTITSIMSGSRRRWRMRDRAADRLRAAAAARLAPRRLERRRADADAERRAGGEGARDAPLPAPVRHRRPADRRFDSNPGDVVYDPFGGLMTVPLRAVKLGRRGLGVELNPSYFEDAVRILREPTASARRRACST
jgi:hypothetical protein